MYVEGPLTVANTMKPMNNSLTLTNHVETYHAYKKWLLWHYRIINTAYIFALRKEDCITSYKNIY